MWLVTPMSYFIFSSVGFTRGFIDLWFSFKEETTKLKRVIPSISYGVIISLGYLSIPLISHFILDSVVGKAPTIGGEDVGMVIFSSKK